MSIRNKWTSFFFSFFFFFYSFFLFYFILLFFFFLPRMPELCPFFDYSILNIAIIAIVRLSLLTMTNSYEMRQVVLFVYSKIANETNLSSKLHVADRTREVWGRKLCLWCLSSGFQLSTFLLSFAGSFCFVLISTPSYEASPLCLILYNMFPRCVEIFKGGFEDVLVSLLLTTNGTFYNLLFFIKDFLWQTFIRHSGNMACPS